MTDTDTDMVTLEHPSGVSIQCYTSQKDGKIVVQIDTVDTENDDDGTLVRVYYNGGEATSWE